MVKFSKLGLVPVMAALALAMSACGDSAPQEDEGSKETDFGINDTQSTLSSEQQKQRLESVATEASQMFRPEDHRHLIELANYWERMYSGLDVPADWESAVNTPAYAPASVLTSLARSLKHGDISTLAFNTFNYYYEFSQFTGIYEPGRYRWNRVGDSNDIIFRFYNDASQLVEVKVTASGSNADFSVDIDDENSRYTVKSPKLIETSITENGSRIMWSRSNVSFNEASHVVDFDIIAEVANIQASAEAHATDTRITGKSSTTIDGKLLANADFVVDGEGMATRSIIEDLVKNPSDTKFCRMFKKATANTDVLGKIQVRGEMTDLRSIIDAFEEDFDNYEFDDKETARQACQQSCDILARASKGRMYFDGSNAMEAELVYKPCLDEYNGYYYSWWEWYIEPMLKFADGTTYSIEGYFTTSRFASVENTWTNLWNSYSRLWR